MRGGEGKIYIDFIPATQQGDRSYVIILAIPPSTILTKVSAHHYYPHHIPLTHWTRLSLNHPMLAIHPQHTGLQWATTILYLPFILNTLDYREPQQYYTYRTPSTHWTTVSHNNIILTALPQHTGLQWATTILYSPHTLNILDYSEPQQY